MLRVHSFIQKTFIVCSMTDTILWRDVTIIKNSSKIMIILAGDRKVSKYIYDYQAGLKLRIRKEQTN